MNLENTHIVIDTETLGFSDEAIVLSIALCPFRFEEKDLTFMDLVNRSYFCKLKVKPQKEKGRIADRNTLEWWSKQNDHIKSFSYTKNGTEIDPQQALLDMKVFVSKCGYDYQKSYMFERGMGYDSNKLQSLYTMYDLSSPFNFWRAREIRTINDLVGDVSNGKWELPNGNPKEFIEHHALHDAALDAYKLIKLFDL